jgi:hypothetical protein
VSLRAAKNKSAGEGMAADRPPEGYLRLSAGRLAAGEEIL